MGDEKTFIDCGLFEGVIKQIIIDIVQKQADGLLTLITPDNHPTQTFTLKTLFENHTEFDESQAEDQQLLPLINID